MIKLLRDIPGYKKGHVFGVECVHYMGFRSKDDYLLMTDTPKGYFNYSIIDYPDYFKLTRRKMPLAIVIGKYLKDKRKSCDHDTIVNVLKYLSRKGLLKKGSGK